VNILVNVRVHLYLAVFGLATVLSGMPAPARAGGDVVSADPEYFAPERVRGRVDALSDLYSLGIIAYELLAGRVPFRGPTPAATLMMQIEEPLPLAPLRGRTPALPVGVVTVLERALAKDPAARYPTGEAFVEALAIHLTAFLAAPARLPGDLTEREVEVLRLVAAGLTNAQAAARLSLSARTINAHLTSIYGKLGVPSRAAAIRIAIEHKLS
jgi:serine/threonine-protein kinase